MTMRKREIQARRQKTGSKDTTSRWGRKKQRTGRHCILKDGFPNQLFNFKKKFMTTFRTFENRKKWSPIIT